jgi:small GTP-binding protein
MTFDANMGIINLNIWDCSGQEKIGGLRDVYYAQSDGAIIMYDITNHHTYKASEQWEADYRRINSETPVIFVGNKCDITPAKVIPPEEHILTSVKTGQDIFLPFLEIIQVIMDNDSVVQ